MLRLEKTLIENDRTGELYIRYTPVFTATSGAIGELRFPSCDCELHGDHEATKEKAVRNAEETVARWARNIDEGRGFGL